jgi:hypothetical protein
MRKQASFAAAIATGIMTGLAVGFWIITSVDETTASVGKVPAPTTHVIQVRPIALPEVLVEG